MHNIQMWLFMSQHCLVHSSPDLVSALENPPTSAWAEYDQWDDISDGTPIERVPWQNGMMMAMWTQKFDWVGRCKLQDLEEEHENVYIDNEMLDSNVPREEPSDGLVED